MRGRIPAALAPLLLGALGGLALGCGGEEIGVSVEDVLEDPARYAGEVVTVQGDVDAVHGAHWFTLDAPGAFQDEMLVFSTTPYRVEEDSGVAATGEVRNLVVAELETEYGIDLDPELEAEFAGRPILVAEAVVVTEEAGS